MDVIASTNGKRVFAKIDYNHGGKARGPVMAKKIPAAHWDGDRKLWDYPLSLETCHQLRAVFGDDLKVHETLAAWYRAEQAHRRELEEIRAGKLADLPRVRAEAPLLWEALQNRPFQVNGVAFIREGKRVCLGDEPRLGKTYQALAALVETGASRVLIACPRTATRSVWARKINELIPQYMPFVAQGDHAEREQVINAFEDMPHQKKILIVNKEMIRIVRKWVCPDKTEWQIAPGRKNGCRATHKHETKYYPEWPQLFRVNGYRKMLGWDAVILDECHHALASTKNIQSKDITQIRMGAVKLPVTEDGMKLAMSGTPFRSDAARSWGVLNWLRPDRFGSFWRYAEEQFKVDQDPSGYGQTVSREPKDMVKFTDALRPYYLARTKAEVASDLPPVDYVEVLLPMEEKQAKAYRDMVQLAATEVENGRLTATGVLAELTRLKQLACSFGKFSKDRDYLPAFPSNKYDWISEYLFETQETEGKVVIVSQFTRLINAWAAQLRKDGYDVLVLTGESSDRERDEAQEEFQHGDKRIILINVFAGGEAIDLSAADTMIFIDEPWTDDPIQQAENRIQNLAKYNKLTIFKLRSEHTIDERIGGMTAEQRELLKAARPEALDLVLED